MSVFFLIGCGSSCVLLIFFNEGFHDEFLSACSSIDLTECKSIPLILGFSDPWNSLLIELFDHSFLNFWWKYNLLLLVNQLKQLWLNNMTVMCLFWCFVFVIMLNFLCSVTASLLSFGIMVPTDESFITKWVPAAILFRTVLTEGKILKIV